MAKIVEPPKPRRVACRDCRAVIEYLPEEVEVSRYTCMGDPSGSRRVKCPRKGCPGYGVIEEW